MFVALVEVKVSTEEANNSARDETTHDAMIFLRWALVIFSSLFLKRKLCEDELKESPSPQFPPRKSCQLSVVSCQDLDRDLGRNSTGTQVMNFIR